MLVFDHLFLGPFSACHVRLFSLISPLFPSQCLCDKIFLHVSMDSTLQCEDIRSVQEIFVHATYVPFTNYQVWGFPVFSGIFHARDVRTMLNQQYWGSFRLTPITYTYTHIHTHARTHTHTMYTYSYSPVVTSHHFHVSV